MPITLTVAEAAALLRILAPSTAATALRQLRRRRLLRLEQRSGPEGRFGLAVYTLGAIPGLIVELPCAGSPHTVEPHAADEDATAGVDDPRSLSSADASRPTHQRP